MSNIEFRFTGGDADNNQINFYDGSRFLYGAARFVHHIDNYRCTGKITDRIYKQQSNFAINSPKQGSFLIDVIQIAAPIMAENAIKVPIEALFSYMWDYVVPNKGSENAVLIEREKTNQVALKALSEANNRTADIAESLLEIRKKELSLSHENRNETLEQYRNEFHKISEEDKNRLVTKLRPAVIEMGRPTYSSADKLFVNDNNSKNIAVIDKYTVESLKGNNIDDLPISLLGSIIQYNKETGWGKFRAEKRFSFVVPASKKKEWGEKIINAMNFKKEEYFLFYPVRDTRKNIMHLIFESILKDVE